MFFFSKKHFLVADWACFRCSAKNAKHNVSLLIVLLVSFDSQFLEKHYKTLYNNYNIKIYVPMCKTGMKNQAWKRNAMKFCQRLIQTSPVTPAQRLRVISTVKCLMTNHMHGFVLALKLNFLKTFSWFNLVENFYVILCHN